MEFYLQMGHGMQSLSEELIESWGTGTIIASPVNITQKSLVAFSKKIIAKGGEILFDPQMFFPRNAHKKLETYSYWPEDSITYLEENQRYDSVLEPLVSLNNALNSKYIILPSSNIDKVSLKWDATQKAIIKSSERYNDGANKKQVYHTVSLSSDLMLEETNIEKVISLASKWSVEGIYLICESPKSEYLVTNPNWLANLMALVAGLKRVGKKVVVGYANHQYLCLSLAKCDAIAAGNFLNVRKFQKERFENRENGGGGKRATWFYSPIALSEYKTTFLDIAKRSNVLDLLKPSESMTNMYSSMLFTEALPSSTSYTERDSFLHYLNCLKVQTREVNTKTYKDNFNFLELQLQTAEKVLNVLNNKGIKGQDRDFGEIIEVNQAAIILFNEIYGFPLMMEWSNL